MEPQAKRFSLGVLVSVVNDTNILHFTQEDKHEVVEHVVGRTLSTKEYNHHVDQVIEHIVKNYDNVRRAAENVRDTILDLPRYNKMLDLFRASHYIQPLAAG